ncbi:hypothetical protein ABPG72_021841 [Tetrahymena utriculariae]
MDNDKLKKVPSQVDSKLGSYLIHDENDFIRALAQEINFDDLIQKNINLYVIGCGKINGIKNFSSETKFPSQYLYVDSERFTYTKLGMMRAETISQISKGKKSKDTKSSFCGGLCWSICKMISKEKQGDVYQLGGTYIFETDGKITYSFVDESSNGHVSSTEITDLVEKYAQSA